MDVMDSFMLSQRRIYSPSCGAEAIEIKDRDVLHKVRNVVRLKEGDPLAVFDGRGAEYRYVIVHAEKKCLRVKKMEKVREEARDSTEISLAFPFLAEEKIDFILQKATELGVRRLIPFISSRNTLRRSPSGSRYERWQKIVNEAVRQSQRLWFPEVETVRELRDIAGLPAAYRFYGDMSGGDIAFSRKKKSVSVLLAVGPQGGFDDDEKTLLQRSGFSPVSLSGHVLRTETAAIFMVGLINYLVSRE